MVVSERFQQILAVFSQQMSIFNGLHHFTGIKGLVTNTREPLQTTVQNRSSGDS
jgi:hypothetical protein